MRFLKFATGVAALIAAALVGGYLIMWASLWMLFNIIYQ